VADRLPAAGHCLGVLAMTRLWGYVVLTLAVLLALVCLPVAWLARKLPRA